MAGPLAYGAFGLEAETALDPRFDKSEGIIERWNALANEFLIEELRFLVVDGRCRHEDGDVAVGEVRKLDRVELGGLLDDRSPGRRGVDHLSPPAGPAGARL